MSNQSTRDADIDPTYEHRILAHQSRVQSSLAQTDDELGRRAEVKRDRVRQRKRAESRRARLVTKLRLNLTTPMEGSATTTD